MPDNFAATAEGQVNGVQVINGRDPRPGARQGLPDCRLPPGRVYVHQEIHRAGKSGRRSKRFAGIFRSRGRSKRFAGTFKFRGQSKKFVRIFTLTPFIGRYASPFQTPAGAHNNATQSRCVPVQPRCELADGLLFPRPLKFPRRQGENPLRRQAGSVPLRQRGNGFGHDVRDQRVVQAAHEHAAQGTDKSHQDERGQRQGQQDGVCTGTAYHIFTRNTSDIWGQSKISDEILTLTPRILTPRIPEIAGHQEYQSKKFAEFLLTPGLFYQPGGEAFVHLVLVVGPPFRVFQDCVGHVLRRIGQVRLHFDTGFLVLAHQFQG